MTAYIPRPFDIPGTPYVAEHTGLYEPDHSEVYVVACHKCRAVAPVAVSAADAEAIGDGRERFDTVAWSAVGDARTLRAAMDWVHDWAEYYGYDALEALPHTCQH